MWINGAAFFVLAQEDKDGPARSAEPVPAIVKIKFLLDQEG